MRHVEVLQLQSHVVIVVVITASGAVSKRVFELEDGVDAGLVDWARAYLAETIVGRRASVMVVRRAFEDPGLSLRERRFLETLRPAFADVVATATELYVGGAAGLVGDATGAELEACQRLLEVLERRAAVLGLLHDALDPGRPVVARRAGARGRGAARDVIRRRDLRASEPLARRGRPARSAADGLRDGDPVGARRGLRALAACTRTSTGRADGDRRAGLLRASRRGPRREPCRDQARVPPARTRAPSGRQREPDAELRFRAVAEAYEVLSDPERRQTYDRFGHAGLRGGGFSPMDADFGSLSDVFAAFFGETLFGQGRGAGPRPARGPDVGRRSRSTLRTRCAGSRSASSVRAARSCETCAGTGAAPGTSPVTCPGCGGAGVVQQVSRTILGQIVRSGTCPRCDGAGRLVETPCERCEGDGRTLEDVPLELDVPAGIHDGQRIRRARRGACRARWAGRPGTSTSPCGCVRWRASTATGTTSTCGRR